MFLPRCGLQHVRWLSYRFQTMCKVLSARFQFTDDLKRREGDIHKQAIMLLTSVITTTPFLNFIQFRTTFKLVEKDQKNSRKLIAMPDVYVLSRFREMIRGMMGFSTK